MNKIISIVRRINLVMFSVCLLAGVSLGARAQPTLGLKFATDAQLAGVPLASIPFSGTTLPASVDLSAALPPPGDQGNQQSCVAWATAYGLKSYQEYKEDSIPLTDGGGNPNPSRVFSPAYIYNQINNSLDGGSLIIDALNVLSSRGAATWSSMPYTVGDYLTKPTAANHADAARYKIDYWRRVNVSDQKELKAQIAAGYPVIIGAMVDIAFKHQGPTSIWNAAAGAPLGGHAMLVVGYDDGRSAFKVLNSWGKGWGDGGYGWISYGLFSSVVREGYVAKDASNSSPSSPAGPSPIAPIGPATPVVVPMPSPAVQLTITNVAHNVPSPMFGPGMLIQGTLQLPAGAPGQGQIVVQIYANNGANNKGAPILALIPQHRTVHGAAATGTPPFTIPEAGMGTTWYAHMPYSALGIPHGVTFGPMGPIGAPIQSYLIAEPVLFINNFGVKTANLIPFTVGL